MVSQNNYEITHILRRCNLDDANFIIDQIDSYVNFSDDSGLKEKRDMWNGNGIMPFGLAHKLETEIRYLGSNDIAYLRRKMWGYEPAGISFHEIIDDVSEACKIKIKSVGSIEYKLENFTLAMIDKKIKEMSPEEQHKIYEQCSGNIDDKFENIAQERFAKYGKTYSPLLLLMLGSEGAASAIIQELVVFIIGSFIGKKAASELIQKMLSDSPFLSLFGPIFMAGVTGWTIIDLSGPAMRKLIPILLWLGVVSLRDGLEEG